jgi:hypothetical protein
MIKQISEERARIDAYKHSVGGARFFNDRAFREDFEWLILSYLTSALSAAGWKYPEYAEKLPPPAPDFQTYLTRDLPSSPIEITEVLRPGYRRGAFHRKAAQSGERIHNIPNPHPQPWSSFLSVLRKKLAKSYSGHSSLLIYHDMADSEFPEHAPWHERLFARLRTWTYESDCTCDLTQSRYQNIFVVDASGIGAVRLYPHWDVIRETPFPW